MKVHNLIEYLNTLNPELEIYYFNDENCKLYHLTSDNILYKKKDDLDEVYPSGKVDTEYYIIV